MITITPFTVGYQLYAIPTIKITHSKILNGSYAVGFIWLKWGVELALSSKF